MEILDFRNYLALLRELGIALDRLTEVENLKIIAVKEDDLEKLNDCMKKEQALSMTVRGIEQRREKSLAGLGLQGVRLHDLPQSAPESLREDARHAVQELSEQYKVFHGTFEIARNLLECNLHQVERILGDMGAESEPTVGYQEAEVNPPENMRANFRA